MNVECYRWNRVASITLTIDSLKSVGNVRQLKLGWNSAYRATLFNLQDMGASCFSCDIDALSCIQRLAASVLESIPLGHTMTRLSDWLTAAQNLMLRLPIRWKTMFDLWSTKREAHRKQRGILWKFTNSSGYYGLWKPRLTTADKTRRNIILRSNEIILIEKGWRMLYAITEIKVMKKVTRDELFARFSEDLIHQRPKRKMAPMRALGEISSAELLVAFPKARDLKNEEHFQIWTAHLGISDGFPSGNRRKGQAPANFGRTFDKSFQCDDQNVVIHWISLWKLIKTFFS